MRFNRTPLDWVTLIIGTVLFIATFSDGFRSSAIGPYIIPMWFLFTCGLDATVRRFETQQRALIALMELYSRYNRVQVMLTLASSEEAYDKAYQEFRDWFNRAFEIVQQVFSVDDAEAFRVIGDDETAGTMVLRLNLLRPYTQANKEVLSQWLQVYEARLSELLKRVPTIKVSFIPEVAPKSPSPLPTASSSAPR